MTSDMDVALGLLTEHVEVDGKDNMQKAAAVLGLGIAYAGTDREDVKESLVPLMLDDSQTFEVCAPFRVLFQHFDSLCRLWH